MADPKCLICKQTMKKVKTMETLRQYKARRFHCELCGYSHTKFGDGSGDAYDGFAAQKEIKKQQRDEYWQEYHLRKP